MLTLGGSISDNGKLSLYDSPKLTNWIKAHAGEIIELSIKLKKKKRSNNQNAYYWGCVVGPITQRFVELGNDFDENDTHEFLKSKFSTKQVEIIDGHYIDMPTSTTKMDTKDFMIYLEKIQQFASQLLDLYIADPNEQTTINF